MSLPVAATAGNHDEHAFNEDDPKLLGQFNQHVNVPKANNAVMVVLIIHLIIMVHIWL